MSEQPSFVRIARVCPKDGCGCRRFFASEEAAEKWRCPDHHQAVVQRNKPYPGKAFLAAIAKAALGEQ